MARTINGKWITIIAMVGVIGVGSTVGLVESAGASNGPSLAPAGPVSTAKFKFTVSVSGRSPSAVVISGTGQANFSSNIASLSVTVPAVVAARIPGGSHSPETINAVLSGSTVYLELPGLAAIVGKPWISVALPPKAKSALPRALTKVASALGEVSGIARLAESHHATVTSLGGRNVDGVHVEGTKIVDNHSHTGKTHTLTATLWADLSDHLIQATVTASGANRKGSRGLTATLGVTGYDSPVNVTVPTSSDVKAIPASTVARFLAKAVPFHRFLRKAIHGHHSLLGTGLRLHRHHHRISG